jgi:hypothetical protein
MCSANKQELCLVAGLTYEDPKKIPPIWSSIFYFKQVIGIIEATEFGFSRLLVALQ